MSKAAKMGAGKKGLSRKRFEIATDKPCVRIMLGDNGRRKFVWGVEAGGSYRHVAFNETELR